jgi:uncharacterized membrane protein
MARFCTSCGTANDDAAGFCSKCGHAMAGGAAVPGAAAPSGGPVAVVPATSAGGLTDNVAGMLAYITFIPAIIFLVMEPYSRNRFVRFHAFQSIFLSVGWIIIATALRIALPWFLWPLWGLIDLALFALWVILLIKAYNGQKWKLPVIGDMAEKQADTV